MYDYCERKYMNNIGIIFPKESTEENFIKYRPDNDILSINIHFLISFPCNNKKVKAIIKAESEQ